MLNSSLVPDTQLETLFEKMDEMWSFMKNINQTGNLNVLGTRWGLEKKVREEFGMDAKTFRKAKKIYSIPTTKIGSKIYVDIEAARQLLEINAKK